MIKRKPSKQRFCDARANGREPRGFALWRSKKERESVIERQMSSKLRGITDLHTKRDRSDLLAREEESLAKRLRRNKDFIISEAHGIELKTTNGKSYIDFTGGANVANLGYAHPKIIEATKNQVDALDFAAQFNGLHPLRIELAEKIKKYAPGRLKTGRLAYSNSGSESAEFSIKLARYLTKRSTIFTCIGAYHGGTMGGLSLTIDNADLRNHYGPFLPNVVPIPFPNCYRNNSGNCGKWAIDQVKEILETNVSPDEVAAIFVEPIQAHAGVLIPPTEYMQELRKLCTRFGILLIADEVVTGFGRTGTMFGVDHFAIDPDVMFFGKPMGAGLPLGGILAREELMANWTSDGPASTLAGNIIACARSLAMLQVIEEEHLLHNVEYVGNLMLRRLHKISKASINFIGDVRGKGLLLGIELVKDRNTKEPAGEATSLAIEEAYKKGLLITAAGIHKNILKISPPLILTKDQADKGVDIIEEALVKIRAI